MFDILSGLAYSKNYTYLPSETTSLIHVDMVSKWYYSCFIGGAVYTKVPNWALN